MVSRDIEKVLFELLRKFPAISITGPRQSGKTTLVKNLQGYRYFSLENPVTLLFAENDPCGFLRSAGEKFIIDEVQYAPILFSYLPKILDNAKENGKVILVGSQNFLLNQHISQSLSERVASIKLLPFSYSELQTANLSSLNINTLLFKGGYPRLHKEKNEHNFFFTHYIQTYLQHDVHLLRNIRNQTTFVRFIKLCAERIGQLLDMSSLAKEIGVVVNTIKLWLSVLEASYIIYLIHPYSTDVNRRLIRTPKLYFYDTGLACSLLNIKKEKQIENFYLRENLFENFVITELIKTKLNAGLPVNYYFLRDARGIEVDCVQELPDGMQLIEIKSSETSSYKHIKNIVSFRNLFKYTNDFVIYSGKEVADFHHVKFLNLRKMNGFLE